MTAGQQRASASRRSRARRSSLDLCGPLPLRDAERLEQMLEMLARVLSEVAPDAGQPVER